MPCGGRQPDGARRVTDVMRVERSDFLHGLAQCPNCRLPLDERKDVDDLIQPVGESRAIGARMTHRRCGESFEVVFDQ